MILHELSDFYGNNADHVVRYCCAVFYNLKTLACGIRTGQQAKEKELAIRPIPAYIVVYITVEYNQEVSLKLSKK